MNRRLVWRIRQATAVGFAGALLLIAIGAAGQPASLPLAVVLVGLGMVGIGLRHHLDGVLDHQTFAAYLTALPAAPLSAGAVLLLFSGATAGEVQTLGGVLGLLAVLNHLLRPLYALLSYLGTRLSAALS